jgi:hypothetical protein
MASPSEHARVEVLDRLAAGTHAHERQQRVQEARQPRKDHPTPEVRGMHQVLSVGFADGFGVLGEQSVQVHEAYATHQPGLRGCEGLAKSVSLRNNVAQ